MNTKIEKVILENGLTVYFYENHKKHSTIFQFITLLGGETKDFITNQKEYHLQDGIAHILEHYIVEHNKLGNFLKLLGEKQMITNAYTYKNMTKYYFDTVEELEFGIETIIKGIYSPIFEQERLEKVKGPIYQEIKGRLDNKFYHSRNKTMANIFHNIKYRTILGTIEEVKKTDLDTLKLCYETFYQPKNQIIVVAGNFDKEKVLNQINKIYHELNLEEKNFQIIKKEEPNQIKKDQDILYFPTGEEYNEIVYKINISKLSPKERLKLDFYLSFFFQMFFGLTSPLYKELIKEKIITTSINCSEDTIDKYLIISIGAYTSKKELLISKIKDTIKNLDSFDPEIFEITKKNTILKIILRNEYLSDIIEPFIDNIVSFNYPYIDTVEDIENLNYEEFIQMIKNLNFNYHTEITIKNK